LLAALGEGDVMASYGLAHGVSIVGTGRFGLAGICLAFDLQDWFKGLACLDFLWSATLLLNQRVGVSLLISSLELLALADEVCSAGVAQLASDRPS
jgi:hypothetical protein